MYTYMYRYMYMCVYVLLRATGHELKRAVCFVVQERFDDERRAWQSDDAARLHDKYEAERQRDDQQRRVEYELRRYGYTSIRTHGYEYNS